MSHIIHLKFKGHDKESSESEEEEVEDDEGANSIPR